MQAPENPTRQQTPRKAKDAGEIQRKKALQQHCNLHLM
jgi:hypothetical protein